MSIKYQKETKSQIFANAVHMIMPYLFLSFLGTIIWSMTYICLYFYKELLLCYIKSMIKFEGVSYYQKLKEYKKYITNFLVFNLIIIVFWIIILFTNEEWRIYIIKSGFIAFILIYIFGWIYYYKYYNYNNNYFDDLFIIMNFIKGKLSKNDEKEKVE